MSHTKEPWHTGEQDFTGVDILCADDLQIASVEIEEDARRIVASVNACAGSSTEWLEFSVSEDCADLSGPFQPIEARITSILKAGLACMVERDQMRQQRDELLARLEVVCEVQIVSPAYDRIRAEKAFAIDDLEYDLFAAGWKAAIDTVKGGA